MDDEKQRPRTYDDLISELSEDDAKLVTDKITAQKRIIDKAVSDNRALAKCLEDVYNNVNLMKTNVDRIVLPFTKPKPL